MTCALRATVNGVDLMVEQGYLLNRANLAVGWSVRQRSAKVPFLLERNTNCMMAEIAALLAYTT